MLAPQDTRIAVPRYRLQVKPGSRGSAFLAGQVHPWLSAPGADNPRSTNRAACPSMPLTFVGRCRIL